jgi:hypothetical protein
MNELQGRINQFKRFLNAKITESTEQKQHAKELAYREALEEFIDLFDEFED